MSCKFRGYGKDWTNNSKQIYCPQPNNLSHTLHLERIRYHLKYELEDFRIIPLYYFFRWGPCHFSCHASSESCQRICQAEGFCFYLNYSVLHVFVLSVCFLRSTLYSSEVLMGSSCSVSCCLFVCLFVGYWRIPMHQLCEQWKSFSGNRWTHFYREIMPFLSFCK